MVGAVLRRTGSVLVLALGMAWARAAAAEPAEAALRLSWAAPEECPSEEAVHAEVLRLAGVTTRPGGALEARAAVERDGDGWRLELTTRFDGAAGERRLTATTCRALAEAAELTLALILNPETETPREPKGKPAVSAPKQRAAAAPPTRAHEATPLRLRALFAAHGGFHAGVAGAPGFELGAGAGLAIERVAFRIAGSFVPPANVYVSGDSGPGGRLWLLSASGLGCFELGHRVVVGPCAGVELTRLAGEGINVSSSDSGVTRWVSIMFGLTAGVPVSRALTLGAGAYALVPLRRPTLYLDALGQVARPAPVGAEIRAGAELAVP